MAPKKTKGRRDAGDGSVYEYPEGSGKWIAQARIDGHLVRRRAASEQGAKTKLAELQELKRQRIDILKGAQLYQDWLGTCYEEKRRLLKPKPRSDEHTRSMMERYIIPKLGTMRLLDILPTHVQVCVDSIYAEIQAEGVYDGARTTCAVAVVLKETLTLAHERHLIPFNPYSGIRLPKYRRKKIVPMDDDQCRTFLAAIRGLRLEALWASYVLLGWRRGEGLGVRWQDFDREQRTIHIVQQVQRVHGNQIHIGTPKTEDSDRTLPLPDYLFDLYCARWDEAVAEHALRGVEWTGQGLIFPSLANTPIWPDNLESQWRTIRDRAGLPKTIKLHHCRHTLATLIDETEGATEALKAGILGHTTETVTSKYTHARLQAMRRVLQAVEDRLRNTGMQRAQIHA